MTFNVRIFYRFIIACFKLAVCMACFFLYLVVSLAVCSILVFLRVKHKRRIISRLIRLFASSLVRIINIKVTIIGPSPSASSNGRGLFLVSNHLGYVDGLVLGSIFPLIYTSKAELKRWPLIGIMTEISGTLFIDRHKKNHLSEYIEDIVSVLKEGANVLFFPEGTSTNGEELLIFKSAFFEAPLTAQAPILPISLIYKTVDGEPITAANRDTVYWYGDMTFVDHFFRLLRFCSIEVEVRLHPNIIVDILGDKGLARKQSSELAYAEILNDLKE